MCEFICTIPEAFLADRRIQIGYIKKRCPEVAKITWQEKKPFNLYNYHLNKSPFNMPYRIVNKLKRAFNSMLGKKYIQRNWELQFLGDKNENKLKEYLYTDDFQKLVSKKIIDDILYKFKNEDPVWFSHPLSMLLTLSLSTNTLKK